MTLLADAHAAAELFTDDLIAADKQLDVMGGSAGAILGLLRLYRDTQSGDVLERATKCGEHLLRNPGADRRAAAAGADKAAARKALNGMSHGAAGFAYALASLSAATGRDEFAKGRVGMHRIRKFQLRRASTITGPISAATENRAGRASGVTALPELVLRASPRQNGAGWIPVCWRRISATRSRAWSGLARSR